MHNKFVTHTTNNYFH